MVEATSPVPGSNSPALEIAIATRSSDPAGLSAGLSASDAEGRSETPTAREAMHSGFTHEEELFRTRWGWAAFDDVQRAAFEAAQTSE
ncbi:MAG: hypothetical protein V4726_03465 [Verrucomicrobiota bacterium]